MVPLNVLKKTNQTKTEEKRIKLFVEYLWKNLDLISSFKNT